MSAPELLSRIPLAQGDPAALAHLLGDLATTLCADAAVQQLNASFAPTLVPLLYMHSSNRAVVVPLSQALWRGLSGFRPASTGVVIRPGASETFVDWVTSPREPMFNTELVRADPERARAFGYAPLAHGEVVMLAGDPTRPEGRKVNMTTLSGVAQCGAISALSSVLQAHLSDPEVIAHVSVAIARCAFGAGPAVQARATELASGGAVAALCRALLAVEQAGAPGPIMAVLQGLMSCTACVDAGMPMTVGQKDVILQSGAADALLRIFATFAHHERIAFYALGTLGNFGNKPAWADHGRFDPWCQQHQVARMLMTTLQQHLHQPTLLEATCVATAHVAGANLLVCRALVGSGMLKMCAHAMYMYRDSTRLIRMLGGVTSIVANSIMVNCAGVPEAKMVAEALPVTLPVVLEALHLGMGRPELVGVLVPMTLVALVQVMQDHAPHEMAMQGPALAQAVARALQCHVRTANAADAQEAERAAQMLMGACVVVEGIMKVPEASETLDLLLKQMRIDVDIGAAAAKARQAGLLEGNVGTMHTRASLALEPLIKTRPPVKVVVHVSLVRMIQRDLQGSLYIKAKTKGDQAHSEGIQVSNMMVTDTVLPVTMQPTVPGACDYPASMDVSDMVVRAMQFEQVAAMHGRAGAGQGVSHIQSMQKLCASLDLGVELSLRRKRTFGRQVLATGVVALSDLLHAQQEPIGVELRSAQGSPVAILHITVKGLEAMGTQEFMYLPGDVPNKAKVVPVTQASARRASQAAVAAARGAAAAVEDEDDAGDESEEKGTPMPTGPVQLSVNVVQATTFASENTELTVDATTTTASGLVEMVKAALPASFPAGTTVRIVSVGRELDGPMTLSQAQVVAGSVITLVVRPA